MPGNKANQSKRVGDTLFMVEASNTLLEADQRHFGSPQTVIATQIPDMLRHLRGSFWINRPSSTQEQFNKRYDNSPIKSIKEISSSQSRDGRTTQIMEIEWRDQGQEDTYRERLNVFLQTGGTYHDHATTLNVYEEGSNSHESGAGLLNMYAEIKSDYNFLEKSYEELIMSSEAIAREPDLPNFYNFLLSGQGTSASNILRNSILSLDRRVSQTADRFGGGRNSDLKPVSSYYHDWSTNYEDYRDNSRTYERNFSAMENVTFTKKETEKLQELYKNKEVFPMFTTTEFTTESDSKFGTTLEDTKFSSQLRAYTNDPSNAAAVFTTEILSKLSLKETTDGRIVNDKRTSVASSQDRHFYDVREFFEGYEPGSQPEDEIFFNEDILPGSEYKTFYNLMSVIAKGRVEKIKKQVVRSYKEILEGQTAYNEVVFYKIRKYDDQDNLLQTFNFTNTSDLELIKFVDTQVRYDKRYTYRISSQNLVIGTSYNFNTRAIFNGKMRFNVVSVPSVKMVEVPLFEKSVLVYDNPPIAPEVQLIPFRAVNDRVRMFLNSAVGRHELEPILFDPEEATLIEKYKISQDKPSDAKKIKFETDDSIQTFILYKLEQAPTSYQDFVDFGESRVVETRSLDIRDTIRSQASTASSACYDDSIAPNRKYYYCARSQDYHGNLSYPTVVYEFEMVDDSGSIYPISRIYEFKEDTEKQPSRGVKRFIHIRPSLRNTMVDTEKMGIEDTDGPEIGQDVSLGLGEDSTWGKKFKVRLTSKTTGKKIDFNFTFKTKQDKSIIE